MNSGSSAITDWWMDRLVSSLENSGVVFIKFGQWISCRPDLFGPTLCHQMLKLTNAVPPHQMEVTRQLIEDTFDVEFDSIFEQFEDHIHKTSGSIAQVHRAVLHRDIVSKYDLPFNEVAVKVRHPMASDVETIALDLHLIFGVSSMFKFIGDHLLNYGYYLTIPISYGEFEQIISRQCDLRYEAANMMQFQANFLRDQVERDEVAHALSTKNTAINVENIKFPTMLPVLCSEDVIMESWEYGHNVADILEGHRSDSVMELNWAIDLGLEAFSRMLFKHRLIHCDMHSGNLLVNEDDKSLIILDGGLCVNPNEDDITLFVTMLLDSWTGLAHNAANIILSLDEQYAEWMKLEQIQEEYGLVQTLENINDEEFEGKMYQYIEETLPSPVLRERAIGLHRDLIRMFDENETYLEFKQKWNADRENWENMKCDKFYELGKLINNLVIVAQRNGIRLRSDFCSLMLSMGVMEGICKIVNPNQDLIERCWPYIDEVDGFNRIEPKFESLGGRQFLLHQFGFL